QPQHNLEIPRADVIRQNEVVQGAVNSLPEDLKFSRTGARHEDHESLLAQASHMVALTACRDEALGDQVEREIKGGGAMLPLDSGPRSDFDCHHREGKLRPLAFGDATAKIFDKS